MSQTFSRVRSLALSFTHSTIVHSLDRPYDRPKLFRCFSMYLISSNLLKLNDSYITLLCCYIKIDYVCKCLYDWRFQLISHWDVGFCCTLHANWRETNKKKNNKRTEIQTETFHKSKESLNERMCKLNFHWESAIDLCKMFLVRFSLTARERFKFQSILIWFVYIFTVFLTPTKLIRIKTVLNFNSILIYSFRYSCYDTN